MNPIPNLAIMASAGTGKTFSLAMRYLSLLKLGVEPDEIVAMTFTNKAAGEIFDKIIQEILAMSADPAMLEERSRNGMLPPDTTADDLFRILRKILCSPKKLQISTLDSFFFNIINAFPMECGIAGEISMLSEQDDEQRVRTLLTLIRDSGDEERRILLELIKQAGMNMEPYSIFAPAQAIIRDYYEAYLKFPDEYYWSRISELAPEIRPEDRMTEAQLREARTLFQDGAEELPQYARFFGVLEKFAAEAAAYAAAPVKPYLTPVEKLAEADPDWLNARSVEFRYYRKPVILDGEYLHAAQRVMRHLLAVEYGRIADQNSARYRLVRRFDQQYGASVRRNGKLTFKDIIFLLRPSGESGALALPFSDRVVLEERLDSVYNHYLLDEFQDTSDEQWRAIANLADEVFQPEQERFRSFFYVGDIKQSIYQWRDGNPELFGMLYRRYSDPGFDGARLELATLARSFRSSVPVIETVNRVFEHPERVENDKVRRAMEKMGFEHHSSAPSAAKQAGFAALISCASGDGKTVPAESVFALLEALDPFAPEHDYTVGVLTLGNDYARETAERFRDLAALRGKSDAFAISVEGVMLLNSSMVFTVCRNLLALVRHPGDAMARGFLSMVKIAERDRFLYELPELSGEPGIRFDTWVERISAMIRSSIASDGFRMFLERFTAAFRPVLSDFDARRMALAVDAAVGFDSSGRRDIAEFLHYLDCMEVKSTSVRRTVQFMTIHKSKGLDFDLVILPELYTGTGIDTGRTRNLIVRKDAEFRPEWVTHPPKKAFLPYFPAIAEAEEILSDGNTYEKCCQLYVAMTRARHALYMMIPDAGESGTGTAYRFPDLLRSALAEEPAKEDAAWLAAVPSDFPLTLLYSSGDVNWAGKKSRKADLRAPYLIRAEERFARLMTEHYASVSVPVIPPEQAVAVRPSEHEDGTVSLLSSSGGGTEFGSLLHELFAEIRFLDECAPEILLADFLERIEPVAGTRIADAVASVFRHAVSTADAAALLNRPSAVRTELWRERRFSIRLNGELITCVFDRVVIFRDELGMPLRVQLVDYKSDRPEDPEYYRSMYSAQLERYASVLRELFQVPVEQVIFLLRSGKTLILSLN